MTKLTAKEIGVELTDRQVGYVTGSVMCCCISWQGQADASECREIYERMHSRGYSSYEHESTGMMRVTDTSDAPSCINLCCNDYNAFGVFWGDGPGEGLCSTIR